MIRAVIFDLDGTLADTEPLQHEAYNRVLRSFGVEVDMEEYRRHWIAIEGGPEYACRTYRLPITPAELKARKAVAYRSLIDAGVQPMPGARAAVERLRATHRVAIATNTVREEVAIVLGQLGLAGRMHAAIAREDYTTAKPAPDAYLAAAAALGLAPRECVVVEDTQRGVRSGLAAGMAVVAVPSALTADNDFTGCARRLASLDELTAALLGTLG